MPALERAIALPEMDDVAVLVPENLHFDMARLLDVFLEVDTSILECLLRLLARGFESA